MQMLHFVVASWCYQRLLALILGKVERGTARVFWYEQLNHKDGWQKAKLGCKQLVSGNVQLQSHETSVLNSYLSKQTKYRVIRSDCRGFNNLAYTSFSRCNPMWFLSMGLRHGSWFMFLLFPPASIPELKVRIRTSIETITANMLQTVWNELDYVCRITNGAHIEHL